LPKKVFLWRVSLKYFIKHFKKKIFSYSVVKKTTQPYEFHTKPYMHCIWHLITRAIILCCPLRGYNLGYIFGKSLSDIINFIRLTFTGITYYYIQEQDNFHYNAHIQALSRISIDAICLIELIPKTRPLHSTCSTGNCHWRHHNISFKTTILKFMNVYCCLGTQPGSDEIPVI